MRPSKPILLVVCGLLVMAATGCVNVKGNEVGVKTVNIALWGERGIQPRPYTAGTHFYNPLLSDFTVLDKSEKKLEMFGTGARDRGEIRLKTSDGNDVWIDATVNWQIDQSRAPTVIDNVGRSDAEVLDTIVVPESRSVIRNILGELTTEKFYNSSERDAKADRAEQILRDRLDPHGILIRSVLVRDYRFSPEYEAAIEKKKVAEEQAKQNRSLTEAAKEDAKRKLRAAEGEAFKTIATANGAKEKVILEANAQLYAKQKQAEAILAQKKAEAEGIRELASALEGSGGRNLIALETARAIEGKRIVMLPIGDGGTINFADVDKLLDRFGVGGTTPAKP